MKKYKLGILMVILAVNVFLFHATFASSTDEIGDLFPDPVLAELVGLNLGMNVDDIVSESDLLTIEVLNFDPGVRVSDFSGIEYLQNLEHLYLDGHGLTSLAPFSSLENLRLLNVELNEISDLSPLRDMVHLEVLLLGGNPVDDVSVLLDLPSLRRLSLFETAITDLGDVSQMVDLEVLDLSATALDGDDLGLLSSLVNLSQLTLMDIALEQVEFLSSLTMLESLTLFNNVYLRDLSPL